MSIRHCLFALLVPLFANPHAWADPLYSATFLPENFTVSVIQASLGTGSRTHSWLSTAAWST
jgi:hypothetical protein